MMPLCVVTGIPKQPIDRQVLYGLRDDRCKIRRVVGRTLPRQSRNDQMTVVMDHRGQFGITPVSSGAADDALEEMAADVMALQSRRVDRCLGAIVDQAALLCNAENSREEPLKSPFLKSRSCAFCSVV